MSTIRRIEPLVPEIKEWRHHLHAHPETAFEEHKTAVFVAEKLSSFGLQVTTGLAGTGVVGTLNRGEGKSILLRADIDALNITECGDLPYKSRHEGKMHACGHDGHTAMLLGAARYLSENDCFRGTVHFVFQPAEENERGAMHILKEGFLERFPAEAVFALHSFPVIPEGVFSTRPGPVMAANDYFEITVGGENAHAGMPYLGKNALLAASHIVTALQSIVSVNVRAIDAAVLSVTCFNAGTAANIIPDSAHLRGTVRTYLERAQDTVQRRMKEVIDGVARAFDVKAELLYRKQYPSVINAEKETALALEAAVRVAGEENVNADMQPQMGSDDFAFFTREKPGCYMAIGSGHNPQGSLLHQPCYDFNDNLLPLGAAYWVSLVETVLPV